MEGVLTPQEAKKAKLSLNPFTRNKQVESSLACIGSAAGVEIVINPSFAEIENGGPRALALYTISPFLGRRALVSAARGIENLDTNGYGKGMEN